MVIPILVLIGKRLRTVPVLGKLIDERFLDHRRSAQRIAGLVGFLLADVLFAYRFFVNHVHDWDLLAVVLAVTVVYLVLIVWFVFAE